MDDTSPDKRAARHRPEIPADDEGLAGIRERFLNAETVEPGQVRDAILASWWRSREFRVPADRIDLPYTADRDPGNLLIRGAEPVLRRLGDQLDGQPISLILTDPTGVVLAQRTGDLDLHRHLESVELVPGFSYGERFVGTNGIGTALESGLPTHVFGHEHYAEHLENLACAGVPIQHPISGKTIGAVDLTCWRKDAGQLLVALARSTAEQIRQALLTHSSIRELTLFQAYLQACRRTTGIVIAFNSDVVIINEYGRQLLDPSDQSVLLGHAAQALAEGRRATVTVTLPTGIMTRVCCRPVPGSRDELAGGVLSVQLIEPDEDVAATVAPTLPVFLPGVVGSSPQWLRCCQKVDAHYSGGEWLALVGEPGTGKYTVARCVHQRRNPRGRLHTLDAADATSSGWRDTVRRDVLEEPPHALVIRHVDRLTGAAAESLADLLREAGAGGGGVPIPWIAVTLTPDAETRPALGPLLAYFPHTVEVPPLRHHIEDVGDLVPLLLSRLGHGDQLTCSPAALHLLMRASWPGNVSQLQEVLRQVAQHRRTGTIGPADLPADLHTVSRRKLNRIELLERDAIVRSLEEAVGNKAKAAELLGMSRATIYRKIHEYGIVTPEH